MQSIIEHTTTNRGAPAIIFDNQKYRKRSSNKDTSEIWICCNKPYEISSLLHNDTVK